VLSLLRNLVAVSEVPLTAFKSTVPKPTAPVAVELLVISMYVPSTLVNVVTPAAV